MVDMNARTPELLYTWVGSRPDVIGLTNVILRDASGTVITPGSAAYTTATQTAVSVGVASGTALAANTSRKYALFINDSDTVIYLSLSGAAALNTGIRLNPGGGSYEMSGGFGNLMTGIIRAISSGATKNLLVLEGV